MCTVVIAIDTKLPKIVTCYYPDLLHKYSDIFWLSCLLKKQKISPLAFSIVQLPLSCAPDDITWMIAKENRSHDTINNIVMTPPG